MIGVLQAELLKMLRHRGIWGLIWIVPIGLIVVWTVAAVMHAGHPAKPPHGPIPVPPQTAQGWIDETAIIWKFAASSFPRYLIGGFAALAIAGEYGWSTWKLIAPHRSRTALLTAKYLVVLALAMTAFVMTALLNIGFGFLGAGLFGDTVPPGIGFGALFAAHAAGFAATLLSTVLTIAYAAAFSVLFRSTLAGAIGTIAAVTLERLAGSFAMFIPHWLVVFLPTYHLDNVQSWITTGRTLPIPDMSGMLSIATSAASLGAWLVGLIGFAFYWFRRQDLV